MDQIKIGKFIAQRRKLANLTQMQLAEKLGITDRAVSKWENGRGLPDTSLMLDLCRILSISVNELLSGEVIDMTEYNRKAEMQLMQLAKEREDKDRELLRLEVFIGVLISVILISCVIVASYAPMEAWARIVLILAGSIPFVVGIAYAIRIEQIAGYYACRCCGHKYVPSYGSVLWSVHSGRTRYMKCPECGKTSWQKKVIQK